MGNYPKVVGEWYRITHPSVIDDDATIFNVGSIAQYDDGQWRYDTTPQGWGGARHHLFPTGERSSRYVSDDGYAGFDAAVKALLAQSPDWKMVPDDERWFICVHTSVNAWTHKIGDAYAPRALSVILKQTAADALSALALRKHGGDTTAALEALLERQ